MKRIAVAAALIALTLAAQAAVAASPEERIRNLEQQIAALQRTYTANAADTVSAVESMKGAQDEMTAMKGQVEANSRILQAQREELMQLIQDLQARVTTLEERMGGGFTAGATGAIGARLSGSTRPLGWTPARPTSWSSVARLVCRSFSMRCFGVL